MTIYIEFHLFIIRLQGYLKTYTDKLKEADAFLKTKEGKEIAINALKISRDWSAGEIAEDCIKAAWNAYNVGNAILNIKNNIQIVKAVKGLVDFIQADFYALNAARLGIAINAASPAVNIPLIGKNLVLAGSPAAAAVAAVFNIIGFAFGIWEVVGNIKKIMNGNELADEFCKQANELEKVMKDLVELDDQLQS